MSGKLHSLFATVCGVFSVNMVTPETVQSGIDSLFQLATALVSYFVIERIRKARKKS